MPSDNNTEDRDLTLCSKCNKPTRSARKGTITQWIARCDCELFAPPTDEDLSDLEICADCGKRINTGRAGSLTQWIFRTDCCACNAVTRQQTVADKVLAARRLEQQPEPVDEPSEIPSTVEFISSDRYKPLKVLGTGASGTVFSCRDLVLDRIVALKRLHWASAMSVIDFQQEAQTTSKLHHPNIVSVLDLSTDNNGTPYMVMEYVDGITLEYLIQNEGPLSVLHAMRVAQDVCSALSYAHSQGILHRDVKSSNILLTQERSYLIDFGIARLRERLSETSPGIASNTIAGSPFYMPPDQSLGKKYDERSEVYSAGCVMFEALAGRPPFVADTALETLSLHAHAHPPAIKDIRPEIEYLPKELEDLVAKCLEKEPEDRFQTLAALKSALQEIEGGHQNKNKPVEFTRSPDMVQTSRSDNRIVLAAGAAALISLIIGGISWRLWQQGQTELPAAPIAPFAKKAQDFDEVDRRQVITRQIKKKSTRLSLSSGFLKDEDIKLLKGYDLATWIDLKGNPITDQGMQSITGTYVTALTLSNTDVKSLDFLRNFPNLNSLHLQGDEISDESLLNLKFTPLISELKVDETPLTDKCVNILSQFKTLELITMTNTEVSESARQRLANMMPFAAIDPGFAPSLGAIVIKLQECESKGNYKEAYKCATEILQTLIKTQGTNAPLAAKFHLVRAQLERKNGKTGEETKQEVLEAIKIARLTHHDQYLQMGLSMLRTIYGEKQNYKETVKIQQELCEVLRRHTGPNTKDLMYEDFNLGELYNITEQPEKAEPIFQHYLKSEFANRSEPRYAWAIADLGHSALAQRKFEQAEKKFLKALDLLKTMSLEKSAQFAKVADIYTGLSQVHENQGLLKQAIEDQNESISFCKKAELNHRIAEGKTRIDTLKKLAAEKGLSID